MKTLSYQNPQIQPISADFLSEKKIEVLVAREDQNHPEVSGNKWWKLKYNVAGAQAAGLPIVTFGGAWSNHIYATAAAANAMNIRSIGIIRGEETLPLNPVLAFARSQGMTLSYISRPDYRNKSSPGFIQRLHDEWGDFYLIPEGGTNELAVKGCEEWGASIAHIAADFVCLPVGTGGTMAGIICGLAGKGNVIGFSVLKGGEFLFSTITDLVAKNGGNGSRWEIVHDYHFGGYAKTAIELTDFVKSFYRETGIPLDPVYTGKMMYGIFDLIKKNKIPAGSKILVLHTGGLHTA